MDNENKEFEDMLKEFSPKNPSHGARWNLHQRLTDLDSADRPVVQNQRSPLFYMITSAAATVLVAVTVWALALRTDTVTEPKTVSTPDKPAVEEPRIASIPVPETPESPEGEPIFIGDEKGVPSVISMKKHITDSQDTGVVHLPDRPPMRRVRQDFINEMQIRDPDTGKVYRVHKPGSETIYIKLDDY